MIHDLRIKIKPIALQGNSIGYKMTVQIARMEKYYNLKEIPKYES